MNKYSKDTEQILSKKLKKENKPYKQKIAIALGYASRKNKED